MNTPHPQAEILRAVADGKTIEARCTTERATKDCDRGWIIPADVLGMIADPVVLRNWELRIKPETITINGHEVPPPAREPLQEGDVYFIANLYNESFVTSNMWTECSAAMLWLGRGLIHLTPEAAIAHAEALLSFTRSDK